MRRVWQGVVAAGALYVVLAVVLGLTGNDGFWWWPLVAVVQGLSLVAVGISKLRDAERGRRSPPQP